MSQELLTLITDKEMELVAKGYTDAQATAAVRRARKWAESIARKVELQERDRVFMLLFRAELKTCERWLDRSKQAMTMA